MRWLSNSSCLSTTIITLLAARVLHPPPPLYHWHPVIHSSQTQTHTSAMSSSSRKRTRGAASDASAIATLTAENQALKSQVEDLKSQHAVIEDRLEHEIKGLRQANDAAEAKHAQEKAAHENEVRRLEEQNDALVKALTAANESAKQAREQVICAENRVLNAEGVAQDFKASARALLNAKKKNQVNVDHFEITIETKGEEFTTFETHAYETICIVKAKFWALQTNDVKPCMLRILSDDGCRLEDYETLKSRGITSSVTLYAIEAQMGC